MRYNFIVVFISLKNLKISQNSALEEEKKPQNQIQVKTAGEQAKEVPKIPLKVSSVKTPVATATKANVPLTQTSKEVPKKEFEADELKDFSIPDPKEVLDAVRNKDIDKLEEKFPDKLKQKRMKL